MARLKAWSRAAARILEALLELPLRFPRIIGAAALLAGFLLASQADWMPAPLRHAALVPADHPELAGDRALTRRYGEADYLVFSLHAGGADMLQPEQLAAVAWLTDRAYTIPCTTSVASISNFDYSRGSEDARGARMLRVEPLIANPRNPSPAELRLARTLAIGDPLVSGRLLSFDGAAASVRVQIDPDRVDDIFDAGDPFADVDYAERLMEEMRTGFPRIAVKLEGSRTRWKALRRQRMLDAAILLPGAFLISLIVIRLTTGSSLIGLLATAVGLLTASGALGLAQLTAIRIDAFSQLAIIPLFLLGLALTLIPAITLARRLHREERIAAAVSRATALTRRPVLTALLALAAALAPVGASSIEALSAFIRLMQFGIVLLAFWSLTLIPAVLALLPNGGRESARPFGFSRWFANRAKRNPTKAALLLAAALLLVSVNSTPLESRFQPARLWPSAAPDGTGEARLPDGNRFDLLLRADAPMRFFRPDMLEAVRVLSDDLRSQERIYSVSGLPDLLRSLNQSFRNEIADAYRLPESQEDLIQQMAAYATLGDRQAQLDRFVDRDGRSLRLTIRMQGANGAQLDRLRGDIARQFGADTALAGVRWHLASVPLRIVGIDQLLLDELNRVWTPMLVAACLALIVLTFEVITPIALTLCLALGFSAAQSTLGTGWVPTSAALVPAPLVLLAVTLPLMAAMSLGYRRARDGMRMSPPDALAHMVEEQGHYVFVTLIVVAASLLVALAANLQPLADFARFCLSGLALLAPLLLFPGAGAILIGERFSRFCARLIEAARLRYGARP